MARYRKQLQAQKQQHGLGRRAFLKKAGKYGLAFLGAGAAGTVATREVLKRRRPLPVQTRPLATRTARNDWDYWRTLSRKRTLQTVPFTMENLKNFENMMDSNRDVFSNFKRFGAEQGGFIVFNPKTRKFNVMLVTDTKRIAVDNALKKAQQGDFSMEEHILAGFKRWMWNDDTSTAADGTEFKLTGDFLRNRYEEYKKFWDKKRILEAARRTEEAKIVDSQINAFGRMFEILHNRLVLSEYDSSDVIIKNFENDSLFEGNGDRFFARFHTHNMKIVDGKLMQLGEISPKDLENTNIYCPQVVFEMGKDFNAVEIAVNGKLVFSKRYPLQ